MTATDVDAAARLAHLEAVVQLLPHDLVQRVETYLAIEQSGVLAPAVWTSHATGRPETAVWLGRSAGTHSQSVRWERRVDRAAAGDDMYPPGLIHSVIITPPASRDDYLPPVYHGKVTWMEPGERVLRFATLDSEDDPVALVRALIDLAQQMGGVV